MAIYKIFPIQDTTVYSSAKATNTGLDEMLEVATCNDRSGVSAPTLVLSDLGQDDIRRSLVLFDTAKIKSVVTLASASITAINQRLNVTSSDVAVSSSLRLFVATATNLSSLYTLEAHAISQQWTNGLGKLADYPTNVNGASWTFRSVANVGLQWNSSGNSTTSSFNTKGGGAWFNNYSASQEFNFASNKDVNMDVTKIVNAWTGSERPNYGFIVKFPSLSNNYANPIFENNDKSYQILKFYSMDTHTIYPPTLELKWNDYSFDTGSTPYSVIEDDSFELISTNNLGTYKNTSEFKFNFRARDKYPTRIFTTQSVYLSWKYLPEETYYSIQDYKTVESVVDFDPTFTKLSVSPSGSYFNLYMNGLEPERSYKILVKTILPSGEIVVKDNDIIFKVIR